MSQHYFTTCIAIIVTVLQLLMLPTSDAREEKQLPIAALLDKSHASLLGVTLESDSGKDVTKKLGASQPTLLPLDGVKDPHHGPYVYCYSSNSQPHVYALFRTGGSEDPTVYEYQIKKGTKPKGARCSSSPVVDERMKTGGGIGLGITKNEFVSLLPGSPKVSGNVLSYRYEKLVKYDVPRQTDWNPSVKYTGEWHYSAVRGVFSNDKLVDFSVSMTGEMDW